MAYVNVKDWSVDQVTEWIKGLDNVILPYAKSFLNNGVNGYQLLNLRSDDLEHLGVITLGHQEIILEAVELLRNFHFELDKENLQMLALRLSCAANSLYKELLSVDDNCTMVQTQTMSDVHNIITTIKPLVCWLDRSPFRGDKDYMDKKTQMLELSFEMATSAHRDRFSEQPNRTIRNICETLAKMADGIIQDVADPMILQPASLDLATLKKKEQELGFFIMPNNHAVHQIAEIKYGSPAHGSSKIEEGDEIVQVNYQTVVGWQRKKVMLLLQESPPEIFLTLKKRPRHTKIYGQIYFKPYRLPSKKHLQHYSRWNENLPSPRLLTIHDLPQLPALKLPPVTVPQELTETSSSSDSETPDSPLDGNVRMYPLKPRPVLQRRNTITGATPTTKRSCPDIDQYWQLLKNQRVAASSYNIDGDFPDDAKFLRDKSASCSHGLEMSPRPTTVIGLTQNRNNKTPSFKNSFKDEKSSIKKRVNFENNKDSLSDKTENKENIPTHKNDLQLNPPLGDEKSLSINSLTSLTENIGFIDEGRELTDRTSMATDIVNEIIDAIDAKKAIENLNGSFNDLKKASDNSSNSNFNKTKTSPVKEDVFCDVHIKNIIRKFDEKVQEPKKSESAKPKVFPRTGVKKPQDVPQRPDTHKKPAVPARSATTKLRGRLDKSHSTPAYDLTPEDNPVVVEKLVVESKRTVVEKKVETETIITSTHKTIKYEPDIPEQPKPTPATITNTKTSEIDDVPPKPPPRTFAPQPPDLPKPLPPPEQKTPPIEPQNPPSPEIAQKNAEIPQKLAGIPQKPEPRAHMYIEQNKPPIEPQKNAEISQKLAGIPQKPEPKVQVQIEQNRPPIGPQTTNKVPDAICINRPPKETENLKYFEPKSVSTPISKQEKHTFSEADVNAAKNTNESKISPTNSIVRAMIYSNKTKGAAKKKHSLIARRRRVGVGDLSPGDIQGCLYQRLRNKQTQNVHWEKRWFVLSGNCLYAFKNRDSARASCLIFLSGFTVAVANEVKSRSNAFKVYHTGTVFYFSADNQETLTSWIDLITAATMHSEGSKGAENTLYSETDESDSEKPKTPSHEKPPESIKKFGSLKKFTSKKHSGDSSAGGSTSLDRKWFFHKSTANSKNSVPVPTAHFRSYRKIKSPAVNPESISTGNFTSHVPIFASRLEIPSLSQKQNVSVPNLSMDAASIKSADEDKHSTAPKSKSKQKNYVHASNPSLCSVSEFGVPSFGKGRNYQQGNENLAGFVTLEELMNRQAKERKLNPHCLVEDVPININLIQPDVVYGEVPIRPREKAEPSAPPKKTHCFGKRHGSVKKPPDDGTHDARTSTYPKSAKNHELGRNRSLPRTHKLQERGCQCDSLSTGHLPDESSVCGSAESLRFGDRSYEMIYCPQTVTDVQFAQNRTLDDRMYQDAPRTSGKLVKQRSLTSADRKGRKFRNDRSEENLHSKRTAKVGDSGVSKVKLKSAMQYTPMSLPLSDPKFAFELNLDERSSKGGKFKFFSKPAEKKEKTFLGSPKLHRAIFRKGNADSDHNWNADSKPAVSNSSPEVSPSSVAENVNVMHASPHTDYPGLEYPPVFEPETYSLADPQSSLTILRKQTKNN